MPLLVCTVSATDWLMLVIFCLHILIVFVHSFLWALLVRWCVPTKIDINAASGEVDLSQVILSNGFGFVKPKDVCFLCGNTRGLKEPCAEEDCCFGSSGNTPFFHPTCARQAGLEVKDDSDMESLFYGKCEFSIDCVSMDNLRF